jgi:hypothetical protein
LREPDEGNLHVRFDEGRVSRVIFDIAHSPTLPGDIPRPTGARSAPYENLRVRRASFVVNPTFLIFVAGSRALSFVVYWRHRLLKKLP